MAEIRNPYLNYSLLIGLLKQWSQRKNIPDDMMGFFIEMALSRANWALRIPPLEGAASMSISETGYIQIPTDFLEMKELGVQIGGFNKILDRKSFNEVDSISNLSMAAGALPEVFGRYGNYFKIAPWSLGGDYNANLYYHRAEPQLYEEDDENWFTRWAPQVLLYGGLSELCDYTRDTEGAMMWKSKFENEINILQAVEDKAAWAGSSLAVSMGGSIKARRSV